MALRASRHCYDPEPHAPHNDGTASGPYCDGDPATYAREREREENPPPGPPAPPWDHWSAWHEAQGRPDLSRRPGAQERAQRAAQAASCVFCDPEKIASPFEEATGPTGRRMRVFAPLRPVTPGHLLVVPVEHAASAAADPALAAEAMWLAASLARQHESANIITSIGSLATQTVYHLHVHVVPRREGDELALPWTT